MTGIELIVRGILIHTDRVLLCRHRGQGYRYLPGGHIEVGEPACVALSREMEEELGIALPAGDFLGASEAHFYQGHAAQPVHEINLYFALAWPRDARTGAKLCDPDDLVSREEKIAFDWIALNDLMGPSPRVSVRPASAARFIEQAAQKRGSAWASDWAKSL